jgi:hypothetical protein
MKKIRNIFHASLLVFAISAYLFILLGTGYWDMALYFIADNVFRILDPADPFFKLFVWMLALPAMMLATILPLIPCLLVILPFAEITTTSEERRRAREAEKMALLRVANQRRKDLLVTARIPVVPLRITPIQPTLNTIRRSMDERGNRRY